MMYCDEYIRSQESVNMDGRNRQSHIMTYCDEYRGSQESVNMGRRNRQSFNMMYCDEYRGSQESVNMDRRNRQSPSMMYFDEYIRSQESVNMDRRNRQSPSMMFCDEYRGSQEPINMERRIIRQSFWEAYLRENEQKKSTLERRLAEINDIRFQMEVKFNRDIRQVDDERMNLEDRLREVQSKICQHLGQPYPDLECPENNGKAWQTIDSNSIKYRGQVYHSEPPRYNGFEGIGPGMSSDRSDRPPIGTAMGRDAYVPIPDPHQRHHFEKHQASYS